LSKRGVCFFVFLLCVLMMGFSQVFKLPEGEKSCKIKFKLVNNLIVIPVEVNGSKLSFILDSGASSTILFNISNQDSIQLNNAKQVIRGWGEGETVKAITSTGNSFKIGEVQNKNESFFMILDKTLNFSVSLGLPIHGIIGYSLFKDLAIEIDYINEVIKFHDPIYFDYKIRRKSEILKISSENKRVFVMAKAFLDENKEIPVKLLVDTGSSDAVWLFKDEIGEINMPDKYFEDFLGEGLAGEIYGKRTKINKINIGSFSFNDAKVSFPDIESFLIRKVVENRNGSIGGELLKRFHVIFDFSRGFLILKRNKNFNLPFEYNMSGINIQHRGVRYIAERIAKNKIVNNKDDTSFGDVHILHENATRLSLVPEIVVSGIRAGSPSDEAGLKEGDIILAVNGKAVHHYKLQEVLKFLNEKEGKKIQVLIERYSEKLEFNFVLKDVFE